VRRLKHRLCSAPFQAFHLVLEMFKLQLQASCLSGRITIIHGASVLEKSWRQNKNSTWQCPADVPLLAASQPEYRWLRWGLYTHAIFYSQRNNREWSQMITKYIFHTRNFTLEQASEFSPVNILEEPSNDFILRWARYSSVISGIIHSPPEQTFPLLFILLSFETGVKSQW
jgi:hypothetical protein